MRELLIAIFLGILAAMLYITIQAQQWMSLFDPKMIEMYNANRWAVATLYDAYCGFITFFCWLAYKERSLVAKLVWFVLIMTLGNIAMSVYMLIQLFRLKPGEPVTNIWVRQPA